MKRHLTRIGTACALALGITIVTGCATRPQVIQLGSSGGPRGYVQFHLDDQSHSGRTFEILTRERKNLYTVGALQGAQAVTVSCVDSKRLFYLIKADTAKTRKSAKLLSPGDGRILAATEENHQAIANVRRGTITTVRVKVSNKEVDSKNGQVTSDIKITVESPCPVTLNELGIPEPTGGSVKPHRSVLR